MPNTITAHPYVRARVLASCKKGRDAHGTMVKGEMIFFHSMEEYLKLANKHHWTDTNEPDHYWCDKPIEISILVTEGDYRRFISGEVLYQRDVFIKLDDLEFVHEIN